MLEQIVRFLNDDLSHFDSVQPDSSEIKKSVFFYGQLNVT